MYMERGNKSLADAIRQRRMAFDITQEEMAEELGMGRRTYQELEAGKTKITLDKEVRVMQVMRRLYAKKTGMVLDERKDNESLATVIKDIVLGMLEGKAK